MVLHFFAQNLLLLVPISSFDLFDFEFYCKLTEEVISWRKCIFHFFSTLFFNQFFCLGRKTGKQKNKNKWLWLSELSTKSGVFKSFVDLIKRNQQTIWPKRNLRIARSSAIYVYFYCHQKCIECITFNGNYIVDRKSNKMKSSWQFFECEVQGLEIKNSSILICSFF